MQRRNRIRPIVMDDLVALAVWYLLTPWQDRVLLEHWLSGQTGGTAIKNTKPGNFVEGPSWGWKQKKVDLIRTDH